MKAKSDIDFDQIYLSGTFRKNKTWNIDMPKRINGFDTETADGRLFMLSYAYDGFGGGVLTDIDSERIFNILTDYKCRNAHNMWYNLSYDAGVLLSHVLDQRELQILKYANKVQTDKYEIMYVKGKFLTITDENKNKFSHFDASQFFYDTLDNAAKEWLNTQKVENVDTKQFGLENGQLNNYIQENFKDIEYYARKDAVLVRELWREFCETCISYDIPVEKPYSTGFMAQTYFETHIQKKPGFRSNDMQELAYNSYAGGRFEIFKRGSFDEVTGYDINSAYPYEMVQLPDPDSCHFEFFESCEISDIVDYEFGMAEITVSTYPGNIQPFPIKDNVRIFPELNKHTLTVTLDEIKMAMKYDMIKDIEIHEAICAYAIKNAYYPMQFLENIYDLRKTRENEGKPLQGMVLKIVMNSLYGKFIQTTPKRYLMEYDENEEYEFDDKERALLSTYLPDEIADELIIEKLESGKLFNPFLATHICARTRVHLLDFLFQNNLENDLIMLATDCVMVQGNPDIQDGWLQTDTMDYIERLGKWDTEYHGNGFVIAPGVYEVKGSKNKLKTRGFNEKFVNYELREYISKNGGNITVNQPVSLGLAIHQGKPISNIGKFTNNDKTISPDMDSKRIWKGGNTWNQLLHNSYESKPLLA